MKQTITSIILIFSCYFSFAQNAAQVSGKITGDNNKPLAAATVSLLKAKDSSLVKTAVTNNGGVFKILSVKAGSYFISATSVGYSKNSSAIFKIAEGESYTAPSLSLSQSSKSLSAITIQAKKPMIEVKADKTVFNVENSINATGSNAFELLQKSPGVTTDKDDNISMPVSYTHLRAHETDSYLVCRLLLEKKK